MSQCEIVYGQPQTTMPTKGTKFNARDIVMNAIMQHNHGWYKNST